MHALKDITHEQLLVAFDLQSETGLSLVLIRDGNCRPACSVCLFRATTNTE